MKKTTYDTLNKAIEFATKKHEGQFRRSGLSYITHPIAVAEISKKYVDKHGLDCVLLSYLHDVIEDCYDGNFKAGYDEISQLFGREIADTLMLLTHDKSVKYSEYIRNIVYSGNVLAIIVKISDIAHNLSDCYVDEKHNKARIEKYSISRDFLEYAYVLL